MKTKDTQAIKAWRYIKANPKSTAKEVAAGTGIAHCSISPSITELYRAKALTGTHRTFINDNARKQTNWQYEAVGSAPPDLRVKPATRKVISDEHHVAAVKKIVKVAQDMADDEATKSEASEFRQWLEFRRLKAEGLL